MTQSGVSVAAGEDVDGLTTGLVSTTSVAGRCIWTKTGARTPLAGVTVSLYRGGELSPLMTVLTDDSGRYRFDGLWPDDYYLEAGLPSGTIFVRPDDPNYESGASAVRRPARARARASCSTCTWPSTAGHGRDLHQARARGRPGPGWTKTATAW